MEEEREDKRKRKRKRKRYSCGTDDISFCISSMRQRCDNIKCFRHMNNILCPDIPHSFSEFKDTEYCPSIVSNDN